jgi:hypothetical protein
MSQEPKFADPFGEEISSVHLAAAIDVGAHIAKVVLEARRSPAGRAHVWDVWRARDAQGQPVAAYILRDEASEEDAYVFFTAVRQLIEAQQKEYCPQVLRVIRTRATPPIVVAAYCDVGRCEDVVALRWPAERAAEFTSEIGLGLVYLHRHEIFHGTLSPYNVLVDEDFHPVLAETGWLSWKAICNRPEQVAKYLPYVAPEIQTGNAPSVASDVYSLGRVLQYVLTGQHPTVTGESVPSMTEMAGQPVGLIRIVRKCCITEPSQRYLSVQELLQDLTHWRQDNKAIDTLGVAHPVDRELAQKAAIAKAPPPPALTAGIASSGQGSGGQGPDAGAATRAHPAGHAHKAHPAKATGVRSKKESAQGQKQGGIMPALEQWVARPRTVVARAIGVTLAMLVPAASCAAAWALFDHKHLSILAMTLTLPAMTYALMLLKMPAHVEPKQHVIVLLCVGVALTWYMPLDWFRAEGAKKVLQSGGAAQRSRALRYLSESGYGNFRGANLSGMDLERANLMDVDLSQANLSDANLYGARLLNAQCTQTNFHNANLEGAHLQGCNLSEAVGLDTARCSKSTLMDGEWACVNGRFEPQ